MHARRIVVVFGVLLLSLILGTVPGYAEKVLRVAIFADPQSIDPAQVRDLPGIALLSQSCESLVRADAHGKILPDLAEKWEMSEDGKTFTFHIRKGVKFHSGNELKAHHFKYAWTRAIAPGIPHRIRYHDVDLIKGAPEVYAGKSTDLEGVQVVNDYTLRVVMSKPHPDFIKVIGIPDFSPLEKEIVEQRGGKEIVPENFHGTGPLRLVSYQIRSKYEFAAFADYWGGKPQIDKLIFYVVPNSMTAMQQYENNELDIVNPPQSSVPAILNDPKLSKEVFQEPRMASVTIPFNAKVAPVLKDLRVRQAINLAVDKGLIAKVALYNTVTPARSIVHPLCIGLGAGQQRDPGYPYDPAKARKLLAEAGYPDGKGFPKLSIYCRPQQEFVRTCEMVSSMLKKNLGIDLKVVSMEFGKWYQDMQKKDVFDLTLFQWTSSYFLPIHHLTKCLTTTGVYNFWNYSDPVFDDLAQKAAITIDPKKRQEAYLALEQRSIGQAAVLPLWYDTWMFLAKPYVKNIDWMPTGYGYYKLGTARIEK